MTVEIDLVWLGLIFIKFVLLVWFGLLVVFGSRIGNSFIFAGLSHAATLKGGCWILRGRCLVALVGIKSLYFRRLRKLEVNNFTIFQQHHLF